MTEQFYEEAGTKEVNEYFFLKKKFIRILNVLRINKSYSSYGF
jgi:hypothetical protein